MSGRIVTDPGGYRFRLDDADALEVCTGARSAFRDGLGLEPSPELRKLQQLVLRRDPVLDSASPRSVPVKRVMRRRPRLARRAASPFQVTGRTTPAEVVRYIFGD